MLNKFKTGKIGQILTTDKNGKPKWEYPIIKFLKNVFKRRK